jgi:hypothetical protein
MELVALAAIVGVVAIVALVVGRPFRGKATWGGIEMNASEDGKKQETPTQAKRGKKA